MKHLSRKTLKAPANTLKAPANTLKAPANTLKALLLSALCLGLSGCEDPQIYGSVGFSSYSGGGYYGGRGMGSSVSIGGRIR